MINKNKELINERPKYKINYGKNKKNLTIFFVLSFALMIITVLI